MSGYESVGGLIRGARRRRQTRRWEAQTFPTSGGGTMRVPYPSGIAAPPETGGSELFGSYPIGELLRLRVNHPHHGPGEPLIFSEVLDQLGFPDQEFPGVEIELPHTAIYGIEGDFTYLAEHGEAPFVGGGNVHLLLNGAGIPGLSPINAGGTVERNLGKTFTLAQEFYAQKGDTLTVVVDGYTNGEPHIFGAIEVATKEPLRVVVEPTPSPLDVENLPQCNCRSEGDLSASASYWDPHDTGFGGLQAGDLIVNFAYVRPQFGFPSSDGLVVDYLGITPMNGWSLIGPVDVRRYTAVIGFDSAVADHVTFFVAKVITDDDLAWSASNPDAPDQFQEYARLHWSVAQNPGDPPHWGTGGGHTLTIPFRNAETATLIDRSFAAAVHTGFPLTSWQATLSAGSGSNDLLTSVVYTRGQSAGDPTPIGEVGVEEWETWRTLVSGTERARVQRAISPQTPRHTNIQTGSISAAIGAIIKVT